MDSIPQAEITGLDLTLEKAVNAALAHNPDLNVSKYNTRLAETEKLQASFFPNPELEFEYENFDEPEKMLSTGYLIELGGKRKHRMELAGAGVKLATAEYNAARVELIYETAAAYIDVLVAQENLHLTVEKEKLADQVYSTSRERVLVSYIKQQREHGVDLREALINGGLLRLRPVLMTAFTTIVGLIPLLLSTGIGSEVQRPLAIVVVFGLISSTFLTLLLKSASGKIPI